MIDFTAPKHRWREEGVQALSGRSIRVEKMPLHLNPYEAAVTLSNASLTRLKSGGPLPLHSTVAGTEHSEVCPKCGGKLVFEDKNTMSGEDIREFRCVSCGESVTENRGTALWYIMQEADKKDSVLHATAAGEPPANPGTRGSLAVTLIGVAFAGGGAWAIYTHGYVPWVEATRDAPGVRTDIKALIIGPFLLVAGLVLLLSLGLPKPKTSANSPGPRRAILGWIVVVTAAAAIIAGIASYFWLRSFLRGRGYVG